MTLHTQLTLTTGIKGKICQHALTTHNLHLLRFQSIIEKQHHSNTNEAEKAKVVEELMALSADFYHTALMYANNIDDKTAVLTICAAMVN
jgi:hypothetical protein